MDASRISSDPDASPPPRDDPKDGIDKLRASIWATARSRADLTQALLSAAPLLRSHMVTSGDLQVELAWLGVSIRPIVMGSHVRGYCEPARAVRTVYVNGSDGPELRRYTAVHEIGHLLLVPPPGRPRVLSREGEESLCEAFASEVLVPRELVRSRIDTLTWGPEELLRLCGELSVNVTPALISAGQLMRDSTEVLVYSRRRGHPKRPDVEDFRFDSSSGAAHVYFPGDQRLSSAGLTRLAAAAEGAVHNESFAGSDEPVRVELRGLDSAKSSKVLSGPVSWRAHRVGREHPFVVALLQLDKVGL